MAGRQISPGNTRPPSHLCPRHPRPCLPHRHWALKVIAFSSGMPASYAVSVRQASALPSTSFRFHLAVDTLGVRLTVREHTPFVLRNGWSPVSSFRRRFWAGIQLLAPAVWFKNNGFRLKTCRNDVCDSRPTEGRTNRVCSRQFPVGPVEDLHHQVKEPCRAHGQDAGAPSPASQRNKGAAYQNSPRTHRM
jgi:hypothetical protein